MSYITKVIDGKAMAKEVFQRIAMRSCVDVPRLSVRQRQPGLAILQIGERADAQCFESEKARAARICKMQYEFHQFPPKATLAEVKEKLAYLNTSAHIDGIVVQLPVPKHLPVCELLETIALEKDVDSMHPSNVGKLWMSGDGPYYQPCTAVAVERMVLSTNIALEGAHVVIIGAGRITGCPIARLFLRRNATVTICHVKTVDIEKVCYGADVLISAVGHPGLVQSSWVKPGAVVIDVGITRCQEGIRGDVDWNGIQGKAAYASPVPGGVGPMTVAALMENTYRSYLRE
ncbi:Methylenetetrahydrofolate dehydrogenase [Perkinsela sp. CCAP 1560/4]|nr:Methylenetetrahydrofolate dehydrogenase [Perkinsela sp. CCAP 1560/4]|eukprot:KNH06682.1 Methylenetetrahydrofolate dehydrogenase [Perkinsela sp. CCAP 1560/4]